MPWHDRLYRLLLRLFPSEFRGDFGDSMAADFSDQRRDAARRPLALVRLWASTILDVLRRSPAEHLDLLRRDATYAIRMLRRHPAAALTAILSLTVGIGLNSAIFSVVGGILWRDLPLEESDRLVRIGPMTAGGHLPSFVSADLFTRLQGRMRAIEELGGTAPSLVTMIDPGEPTDLVCAAVTSGYFAVLKVRPALGPGFTRDDYDAHTRALSGDLSAGAPAPQVAILSNRLWRTRFGTDPQIVGKHFRVAGGSPVRIAGVMGADLEAFDPVRQCFVPEDPTPAGVMRESSGVWRPPFEAIARLAPGRTVADASAELAAIGGKTEPDFHTKEPTAVRAVGLLDTMVGEVRTQLLFVFGAVLCVLLVTCANIVNLFLAHVAGRRDELGLRSALGASRLRLLRQALTESLVVAACGGAGGFVLAVWAVPILVAMAPADLPRLSTITVDRTTFLFTLGVATAVGITCALAAAFPARRAPSTIAGVARLTARPAGRLRRAVIVGEVALALLLGVAATLMVRTVRELNAIHLGFDPRAVVTANVSYSSPNIEAPRAAYSAIVDRVQSLPGVTAVGLGMGPLAGGMFAGGIHVAGDSRTFELAVDVVTPGYFEALGARLHAGRFFERRDTIPAQTDVVVINQSAARLFWGNANPIGKSVLVGTTQDWQVIGVVGDMRGQQLEAEPDPTMYQLNSQSRNFMTGSMVIRVDGDPEQLSTAIGSVVRTLNREAPFRGVEPLQERIDRAMAPRLFLLRLTGLFSLIGLGLAVVGVYGVLAESVSQRVPEIGVRIAFGATARDIMNLILGQGVRLVMIGVVLGVAGALLLQRVMATMVYGVETSDPLAYLTAVGLLTVSTAIGCAIPAFRAARLDPTVALRSD